MTNNLSALLIAGPTASGKSELALNLARELDGVIVNADSMQVYGDLRVLSARPSEEDMKNIPHMLYGHVDGAVNYSTGKWLEDMAHTLLTLKRSGKLPVITGGTGLYFKALLEGLVRLPDIDETIRLKYRDMLSHSGPEELHKKLLEVDAELGGRIAPTDGQRIVRGLEVFESTGRPLSHWHREEVDTPLLPLEQAYPIVVTGDREKIYTRCDARFDAMIKNGALDEVAVLKDRQLDPHLPVMKVIGVPELISHLNGKLSIIEAAEKVKTLTRRYAKRQLTWLRRNMITWNSHSTQDSERILLDIFPKLRKNS